MKKTLAVAGIVSVVGLLVAAQIAGYLDLQIRGSAPGNPTAGWLRLWNDTGSTQIHCKTPAGAACYFDVNGSGITLQTNGTNNSLQTLLNLKSGGSVVVANPTGGDVTITGPNFQTNSTNNGTQTSLNIKQGSNITITNSGADVTIAASAGTLTLQTNGVNNSSQSSLNFQDAGTCAWTNPSAGNVQVTCTGGSGGVNTKTSSYTAVSGDSGKLVTFNCSTACTLTLPASPPSATWWIATESTGAGTLTVSPNGLNLDGSSSSLTSVITNLGLLIFSNGSNYFTSRGMSGSTSLHNCIIENDTQSSAALSSVQISGSCEIPAAATITEVDLLGGTGTVGSLTVTGAGQINIQKYTPHTGAVTTLLSGALATSSGKACALTTTSGTCANGDTSSGTVTISTTTLSTGDWVQVSSSTADGTQTWFRIAIIYSY